jgi:hypothetical protein
MVELSEFFYSYFISTRNGERNIPLRKTMLKENHHGNDGWLG